MAAVNNFQLEIIDEFLKLCKKYSNGYFDECYLDLLNKILLLEIKDYLPKRYLLLFQLDDLPNMTYKQTNPKREFGNNVPYIRNRFNPSEYFTKEELLKLLEQKIDKSPSGGIEYSQSPDVILESMNLAWNPSNESFIQTHVGETHFCTDGLIRHFYIKKDKESRIPAVQESNPSVNVIYYNKSDKQFYQWTGAFMEPITTASNPISVSIEGETLQLD